MSLRGAALSYSRSSSESANIAIGSSRLDFFKRYACNIDGVEGRGRGKGLGRRWERVCEERDRGVRKMMKRGRAKRLLLPNT